MCTDIPAQVDPFYLLCTSHRWCVTPRSGVDAPKLTLPVLAPDLEAGKYIGEVLTLTAWEPVWVQMQFNCIVLAQSPGALKHYSF